MNDFKADIIISDAVPDFIGERFVDHVRAVRLNLDIVAFCEKILKPGGNLLMKIIQGPGEQELQERTKHLFKNLQKVKPAASRSSSAETYYLLTGFEQAQTDIAKQRRELARQIDLARDNPQKLSEILEEVNNKQQDLIQEVIGEIHKQGDEIKGELKEFF